MYTKVAARFYDCKKKRVNRKLSPFAFDICHASCRPFQVCHPAKTSRKKPFWPQRILLGGVRLQLPMWNARLRTILRRRTFARTDGARALARTAYRPSATRPSVTLRSRGLRHHKRHQSPLGRYHGHLRSGLTVARNVRSLKSQCWQQRRQLSKNQWTCLLRICSIIITTTTITIIT